MNGTVQSSRNFEPSSSNRKFDAAFASSNIYFTENSRWVPLRQSSLKSSHVTVGIPPVALLPAKKNIKLLVLRRDSNEFEDAGLGIQGTAS